MNLVLVLGIALKRDFKTLGKWYKVIKIYIIYEYYKLMKNYRMFIANKIHDIEM